MELSPNTPITVENFEPAQRFLRIAVVTETWPPEVNGVAVTLAKLVHHLGLRHHTIQLIRPRQDKHDEAQVQSGWSELLLRGLPIPRYPQLKLGLPSKKALLKAWSTKRPDLVHIATEGPLSWSALQAAHILRLPVTSDFRTNFHSYCQHYGVGWLSKPIVAYLRKFHNRTAFTMVPTQAMKYQLDAMGFKNLKVVARGVDTHLFHPDKRSDVMRASWGVTPETMVLLSVGRLAAEKNLDLTIQTYQALIAAGRRVKMVFAGDGPMRALTETKCPDAIFMGMCSHEQLSTLYASADLLLFPSLTETFGKVKMLQAGEVPIYEPGLKELLSRNHAEGRIRFTTDAQLAIDHGDILFIAVGTPAQEDGSADLAHVLSVASMVGRNLKDFKLIVNKSTVPVGTADRVRAAVKHELTQRGMSNEMFDVVSNPEFLKEGAAIDDFMRPDRIVVGIDDGIHHEKSQRMMGDLYASFNRHHSRTVWMDVRSAELTKYAANAMLATRISFMNEIANLADALGADVDQIRRGIGADNRIGYSFLYAGCGYGGSCFPKDTQALVNTALAHGQHMSVVGATEQVNERQKTLLVDRLVKRLGNDLTGRKIAVWGLAFKPNTDDMREAPSRVVIKSLLERGAHVTAYDPVAGHEAMVALKIDCAGQEALLNNFTLVAHDMDALHGVDALMVLTEWKNFHNPDFQAMKLSMRTPYILDGRNLYNPDALADLGIAYQGVGRRNELINLNVEPVMLETPALNA